MLYGNLPKDLGLIDIHNYEMMFWMYCPIKMPENSLLYIPDNLKWAAEIVIEAAIDFHDTVSSVYDHYIYLTAKTLYVSGSYIGNRPGWHSDGFGTDDINYVWCDRAPTEFLHLEIPLALPVDCDNSMRQMEDWERFCLRYRSGIVEYPDKHLLRLDQTVIHRSPVNFEPGMRTFVKVSISKDRYDLVGNSLNHKLDFGPLMAARQPERNHPASATVSLAKQ